MKRAARDGSEPEPDRFGGDGGWPLPEGWAWTRVGYAAEINPHTSLDHVDPDEEIPFVPMAAVSEEAGAIDISRTRRTRDIAKGYVRFRQGDVIFAKITPCMENGKIAPVPLLPRCVAAGSTEFHVIRPLAAEQKYLWYWLVTRAFRSRAKRRMSGSAGQLRVPADFVRDALFPLAPLAEQRRIVERIDALFTEIEEGERALREARAGLETYRRALLKAAVTGELTRDWREKNKPTETANDLLARIRAERAAKTPANGRRANGAAPASLDAPTLAKLPGGWAWCTVEDAGDVRIGRQRAPKHHTGEHMRPYLRVANVFEARLDLSDVKEMNFTPDEFQTFALRAGDILLNEGQSPDLLGRSALYRSEIEGCCFQNTLLRFRAKRGLFSDYALIVFRHQMHSGRYKKESRITTNIAHLSQGRFVRIEFPLPPSDEQHEIVCRYSECEPEFAGTTDVACSTGRAALRQSILKAAFEGRLVPQDPKDEPASALLAKVKPQADKNPRRAGRRRAAKASAR